jgi:hypothetical protein
MALSCSSCPLAPAGAAGGMSLRRRPQFILPANVKIVEFPNFDLLFRNIRFNF